MVAEVVGRSVSVDLHDPLAGGTVAERDRRAIVFHGFPDQIVAAPLEFRDAVGRVRSIVPRRRSRVPSDWVQVDPNLDATSSHDPTDCCQRNNGR